ncbi:MAG: thioredoxin domain-containing protein [Candidatus Andersenbacteria bacterium]|nr:thioredoxin domain-containing protein [Candidatus Andersenbacteria bacterium]MBI3250937.1 thioredoxin domain-containing protein [Candidatus Andersenbacteria bacterium]
MEEQPQFKKEKFTAPMAVVVAGALIAAALYFRPAGSPTGVQPGAEAPSHLTEEKLIEHAEAAGVPDVDAFQTCLEDKQYDGEIDADLADAAAAGGTGTPYTILIGPNGEKVPIGGALPYEAVKAEIDNLLAGKTPVAPANPSPTPEITFRVIDDTDHARGPAGARITMLEYSDIECPYCQQFHPTLERVMEEYPNDVRWVYRHFPLEQIHPHAREAANATECAAVQGKFWELTDYLFTEAIKKG